MIWLDIIVSLVLALLFTYAIISVLNRRRDTAWPGGIFYFVILFLSIWAARMWLNPVVWSWWGSHLLALVLVGLIVTLAILAALAPRRLHEPAMPVLSASADIPRDDAVFDAEEYRFTQRSPQYSYGLMFWLLVIALVGAVIAGLVAYQPPL